MLKKGTCHSFNFLCLVLGVGLGLGLDNVHAQKVDGSLDLVKLPWPRPTLYSSARYSAVYVAMAFVFTGVAGRVVASF